MPQQQRDLVVRALAGKPGRYRDSLGNSIGRAVAAKLPLSGWRVLLFGGGSLWRFGLCEWPCVSAIVICDGRG